MKGDVDGFLHHLNSIRPTQKFTIQVEEGGSLPFLDTKVSKKEDGKLDITVNHKLTHRDRYLHFRSHQSTLVKRGAVRCTTPGALRSRGRTWIGGEEDHLMKAFMLNGYSHSFICSATAARPPREDNGKGRRRDHSLSTSLM